MAGPWEKFGGPAAPSGGAPAGPWTKFGGGEDVTEAPMDNATQRTMNELSALSTSKTLPAHASKFESAVRGIGQGLTLGFGDEIGGALQSAGLQQQGTDQIREDNTRSQQANPGTYMAGELGGAVGGALAAPAIAPLKAGMLGGKIGATAAGVGNAAIEGGALSGAYGAGTAEGGIADRIEPALKSAAIGAVTGGALRGAGEAIGAKVATRAAEKEAVSATRSTEAIKDAGTAAFKRAEDSGVVINPSKFDDFAKSLPADLKADGFHPKVHTKTAGALEAIADDMGSAKSIGDIHNLRKVAKAAAGSIEPEERRMGGILQGKLDDFLDDLTPSDVSAGNVKDGVDAFKEGMKEWSTFRKADKIDQLMERAKERASQFSGSGLENAITTEFRSFVKNLKNKRGFTNDEWTALQLVGRGTPTVKALRMLGKFAPTGVVSAALGGMAIGGGGVGGAAVLGGGSLARMAATKATTEAAERAGALVRRGGTSAEPVTRKEATELVKQLRSSGRRGSSFLTSRAFADREGAQK